MEPVKKVSGVFRNLTKQENAHKYTVKKYETFRVIPVTKKGKTKTPETVNTKKSPEKGRTVAFGNGFSRKTQG